MRARANSPDYVFLSLVGVLVVFGLIVLTSASSVFSYEKFGSSFYLVWHQLLLGVLPGLVLFFTALRIPYQWWQRFAAIIFGVILVLLLLVVIPGVGSSFGGSRSWFTIGNISFQPSEVAKLGLILYLAAWFESRSNELNDFKREFLPLVLIVGSVGLLIMLQPDIGTLAIVGAIVIYMTFIAGIRLRHLGIVVGASLFALMLLVKIAPYRVSRITSFIHPELDPQGIGYHINQALLAVGSGGLFGVGFGNSRQKFRYLPEVTGDSIFPIIAEELGFIVAAGFIILTGVILWKMFNISTRAPNQFSRLTVLGITGWFGIQTFVNIGSMVGVLPLTGLPLPFVSYGGTALTVELLAVGIVGSISRHVK